MIAKKHIKRINELLNSEAVAASIVRLTPASNKEKITYWVEYGRKAAKDLEAEYGIVSSAGAAEYWASMAHHFPNPHQD